MSTWTRRGFLQVAGGLAAAQLLPGWGQRALAAAPGPRLGDRPRTLVVVFLRGAVDGLSLVAPYGDPAYHDARPGLALGKPGSAPGSGDSAALKLDDLFGLHPALAPLQPLFQDRRLAVVHEAGLTDVTRSHFDAQDWMESGRGNLTSGDGFLNRCLGASAEDSGNPFEAVAVQPNLPRMLAGKAQALAFPSLAQFKLNGMGRIPAASSFESMYAGAVDTALRVSGAEAFDALATVNRGKLAQQPPENGAQYPRGPLAEHLQDIARLIRAGVGLRLAVTEAGGWDSHIGQAQLLQPRLQQLGQALAAFAQDLGPRLDDVCLVTLTEFGRTVHENGNRGTDHGRASAFFVLGGDVRGGRVLTGPGGWRGLEPQHLYEGRDLDVRWDYRSVLTDVLQHHLRLPADTLAGVFPGWTAPRLPGLFG